MQETEYKNMYINARDEVYENTYINSIHSRQVDCNVYTVKCALSLMVDT
jgi:hypothetical protein